MTRRELMLLLLGGALTASRGLRAEQKAMPVIGYLNATSPGPYAPNLAAFLEGLGEAGWFEGQNVAIKYRWADNHNDRLPAFAADLVADRVDVIVASGGLVAVLAAKSATSTIPIVFPAVSDPVAAGLVASFARPGGNLTGFSPFQFELMPKRLELLSELVAHATVIALLVSPNDPRNADLVRDLQQVARDKGLQLHVLKANSAGELDVAFASLTGLRAEALVVGVDPFFFTQRGQLISLAARHAVPAIYPWRDLVAAGGLISYGANIIALHRQAGIYTGRILKGEKPADLPVQQPTTFELAVNLKTAEALGITVPPSILARADEVIE
jgi:putative ABC transport system substrate-binding protein